MKARVLRRGLVTGLIAPEQNTRLTGGGIDYPVWRAESGVWSSGGKAHLAFEKRVRFSELALLYNENHAIVAWFKKG